MENENLNKIITDNPNDYDLGLKLRQMKIEGDLEEEQTDFQDKYLRLSAEFDNFRKRTLKDKNDAIINAKIAMLEPILDIDSDISIAALHSKDEGIQLIISKLEKFLLSQGIESIQTDTYDSDLHEVISIQPGKGKKILSVVSKGYTFGEKIIRYPKVVITE